MPLSKFLDTDNEVMVVQTGVLGSCPRDSYLRHWTDHSTAAIGNTT